MDPILAFCLFFFLALFFSFFQNRASSNEHSNKSIIVNWIQLFIRDNAKMPRTRNKASRAYKAMRRKFHRHNVSQARRERAPSGASLNGMIQLNASDRAGVDDEARKLMIITRRSR